MNRRGAWGAALVCAALAAIVPTAGSAAGSTTPTPTTSTTTSSTTPTPTSSAATTPTPSATSSTTPTTVPTSTSTTTTTTPPDSTITEAQPGGGAVPEVEQALSPVELAQQIAAADALRDELTSSTAGVAAAAAKLELLAAQSNALLENYAVAKRTEQTARAEAALQLTSFERLTNQAAQDRDDIGRWAYEAYSGGGSFATLGAVLDTLSTDPANVADHLAELDYLGTLRQETYGRSQTTATDQRDAAAKAVEAATTAATATHDASKARTQLVTITREQNATLASLRLLHAEQASKGSTIAGMLIGLGSDEADRAAERLLEAMRLPDMAIGVTGKACSENRAVFPNGQIPASALCPLYLAPGESLRPTAAAAFNALSQAYERDTGSPICVTDSYRSLPEQIVVKAQKGKWAATPGTSEHGNGLALDLCGGINSFGTAAHLWMKQHAPLYGWFHPAWAEPTGSLPEPWHWEYAGS